MEKALALRALDRIEAALARIENAAPALVTPTTGERDVYDLERRHADLKQSVARSLSQLDELISERT